MRTARRRDVRGRVERMERTGSGGQGEDGHAAGGGAGGETGDEAGNGAGNEGEGAVRNGERSQEPSERTPGRAPELGPGTGSAGEPEREGEPERGGGSVRAGGPDAAMGSGPGSGPAAGFGAFGRRPEGGGASARGAGPLASFAYTAADEEKQRGVRRMKLTATGLLLFVAVVYVLATWAKSSGVGGWPGYVAAAAEAGMVGALADWFAVTALFRRPLGLPIPHTAIIPTKKDQLGQSLGSFVGENFLSGEVIRDRIHALGVGRRLGVWLAEPAHADRVTAELATALRGALTVLRDSDVQAVVGEAITRRANAMEVGPGLGTMLEKVVTDGGHRKVVDLVCARAHDWLVEHGDSVMNAVQGGAPGWTPRFVDKRVGERVYKELLRFVTEMRDMPEHPARGSIDTFLTDFAADLQNDADTRARVERLKSEILGRGEVQDVIASVWSSVRTMILSAAEDERSELRLRACASLMSLGARLAGDERLQGKLDGWLEDAAVYVVTTYRAEIVSLISDTVASWDADQTSKKIEAHIGRDLQFIRINGTVVGALAGLAIYTVSHALGG
ncbi:DUF445 domain-containing protein [Streptomyces californicus]|uniref:DUF445 domain-containing protein n=1 Tax=Streptomyces californicus TaxID=67351 RepID=UPI0038054C2F